MKNCLKNVREKSPLVHNITNYVTVNDCANIIIASGAAPIMADDALEVADITSICGGLNINIGTLNARTINSMLIAGKRANELCHPVLLDPVGAGASKLRTETAYKLLEEVNFSVIRGNISEIKTLALGSGSTKGVDADVSDAVNDQNIDSIIALAKAFSAKTGAIIAITGATDIVADKGNVYIIKNGVPMLSQITGSGCMLSAMTTGFITANQDDMLKATASAICAMGICGEKAYDTMVKNNAGNSSFRNYVIDEVFKLDEKTLESCAKYEFR